VIVAGLNEADCAPWGLVLGEIIDLQQKAHIGFDRLEIVEADHAA
jgi:hypothetical protein